LLAAENREGELPLASTALPNGGEDVFALRVRGDSMIDAHICDGDLVLVRRQETAQSNDIVVAMVASEATGEGEATVKRYLRDGARVVLKPENPTMSPIIVDPKQRELRILGKVIGLLRGF
jgi:repressor LexA